VLSKKLFVVFFLLSVVLAGSLSFLRFPEVTAIGSGPTTTLQFSQNFGNQPHSFVDSATGRVWLFYTNGTHLKVTNSTDMSTWFTQTAAIRTCTDSVWFCVSWNDTSKVVSYVFANNTISKSTIFYRRGTISSVTITWTTAEQTAVAAVSGFQYLRVHIVEDSSGVPVITYAKNSTTVRQPFITKGQYTNGSWGTPPSGFPFQLAATNATIAYPTTPICQGLANKNLYVVWAYGSAAVTDRTVVSGRFYNFSTTTWASTASVSTSKIKLGYCLDIVQDASRNLHLTFWANSSNDIVYMKRTGAAWGSETVAELNEHGGAAPDYINVNPQPVIFVSGTDVYILWAANGTNTNLYVASQVNGVWTAAKQNLYGETTNLSGQAVGVTINVCSARKSFCLFYSVGAGSPYTIRSYEVMLAGYSSSSSPIYLGTDRSSFYAAGLCWRWYFDSTTTNFCYQTSSDQSTTWGPAYTARKVGNAAFSVYYNGSVGAYVLVDTRTYYRAFTPNADSTVTWLTAEAQVAAEGLTNAAIILDSGGYPWITGRGASNKGRVYASSVNTGGWTNASGFPQDLNTTASTTYWARVVPQTSRKVLCYYGYQNNLIWTKAWNGSTFATAVTIGSIATQAMISASNSGDEVGLVYNEVTSYNLIFKKRFASETWSSAVYVQNSSGSSTIKPAISFQSSASGGVFKVFWAGYPTANTVYYRTITNITLDAGATTLSSGDTLATYNKVDVFFQAFTYNVSHGIMMWSHVNNSAVPYLMRSTVLFTSANQAPTIGSLQGPATVYAWQAVNLNVTVRDLDGRSGLKNCTLSLSVGSVDFTWTESTNATAIVDASNYAQLDSATISALNSTAYKITWTCRFYWNYTEGAVTADSETKVFDDVDATASATGSLFTFEEDLIVGSASVNDTVSNPSQGLKFTGQLYYQGTSTGPYSTSGITASVYLGASSKGSNSSVASDGTFTISFSAQSSVGNSSYIVFSTTDQNSVTNGTVWSVAEQIRVYWEQLPVNHTNINANLDGRYRATLVFTGHGLGSGDSLSCSWAALSWVGGSNWWALTHTESTTCAVTVSGWTGTEATYGITSIVENITETSYIYDTLVIYSLQVVQYVGDGGIRYQARIKYGYSGNVIDGAKVNVSSPSANIGQMLSNSSGWVQFVLDQGNATVQGTYTIFGVDDMVYTVTVAGANQTFSLNKWMLNVTDMDGNGLTNSVVKLDVGSTEVYNGTLATFYVPSDTFNVTVTWYALSVNTTMNLAVSADTNTTVSCLAYPYLVESVRYWAASNCTISSASIASSILTVSFSEAPGTYLLVASCTTRPSYVLNVTYDMTAIWGTYLSLTHYGNATLKISYESWGGFYISSIDRRMTECYWTDQKLSLTFQGTTGQTGTVEIYCGTRGPPADYIGFSTGVYSGSSKIWTGTYAFSSPKSVELNWASSGGGGGGGGGTGPAQSNILVYVEYLLSSRVSSGSVTNGTVRVSWSGPFVIYVYDIYLGDNITAFELEQMPLPLKLERPRGLGVSEASFSIFIRVPAGLATGNYTVPCKLVFRTDANTEVTDVGSVEFSVIGQASSVPEYMTLIFLSVIGCIFAVGLFRRKRSSH